MPSAPPPATTPPSRTTPTEPRNYGSYNTQVCPPPLSVNHNPSHLLSTCPTDGYCTQGEQISPRLLTCLSSQPPLSVSSQSVCNLSLLFHSFCRTRIVLPRVRMSLLFCNQQTDNPLEILYVCSSHFAYSGNLEARQKNPVPLPALCVPCLL